MGIIVKKLECILTEEEINSPEDIKIELDVKSEDGEVDVTYTINYPKN